MKTIIFLTTLLSAPLCFASTALAANSQHVERLRETNQCPNCDLRGANLEDANLFGANLVNANLQGANLNGANLGSANLTDADLSGATLRRAYLYQATLDNTDLSQTDLTNAYFREVSFEDVDFSGAKLQGVNLRRTNLVGIDFQGVDLSGANLNGANLSGIEFNYSMDPDLLMWGGPNFAMFFAFAFCGDERPPNLDEANEVGLARANFEGANLSGTNLSRTVLVGANLTNANLSSANLSNACLTYAQLNDANLDNTNLEGARLYGTNFVGSNWQQAKNADFSKAYRTLSDVRQAELEPLQRAAKQTVGSMNRAQQAYYLEEEKFATNIEDLGIGIRTETESYRYEIIPQEEGANHAIAVARARQEGLKSYTGVVAARSENQDWLTFAQICETVEPSQEPPTVLKLSEGSEIECPAGSRPL